MTIVIASGNVGAVLAKQPADQGGQWYLRELAAHELQKANTLYAVPDIPKDHMAAFEGSRELRTIKDCSSYGPVCDRPMVRAVRG